METVEVSSKPTLKQIKNMKDAELFNAFKQDNENIQIRNEIILRNQPLIVFIIKKYYSKITFSKHCEDLVQEGTFGLIDAIKRFDPDRGFKFSTYATAWIRQSVNNFLMKSDPLIKVPSHVRAAQYKLLKQVDENKTVSSMLDDLKDDAEVSKNMSSNVAAALKVRNILSIEHTYGRDDDGSCTLKDLVPSEETLADDNIDNFSIKYKMNESLHGLTNRELLILLLRFDVIKSVPKQLSTSG